MFITVRRRYTNLDSNEHKESVYCYPTASSCQSLSSPFYDSVPSVSLSVPPPLNVGLVYTFSVYFLMRLSAAYLFLSKLMQTDTRRKKDFDPLCLVIKLRSCCCRASRPIYCTFAILLYSDSVCPSGHPFALFFLVLYTNVITHNDR